MRRSTPTRFTTRPDASDAAPIATAVPPNTNGNQDARPNTSPPIRSELARYEENTPNRGMAARV